MSRLLFDTKKEFATESEMVEYMDKYHLNKFHHGYDTFKGVWYAIKFKDEPQPETEYFPSDRYLTRYSKTGH